MFSITSASIAYLSVSPGFMVKLTFCVSGEPAKLSQGAPSVVLAFPVHELIWLLQFCRERLCEGGSFPLPILALKLSVGGRISRHGGDGVGVTVGVGFSVGVAVGEGDGVSVGVGEGVIVGVGVSPAPGVSSPAVLVPAK